MEIAVVRKGACGLALDNASMLDLGVDFGELGELGVRVSSMSMSVCEGRLGAKQHEGRKRAGEAHCRGGGRSLIEEAVVLSGREESVILPKAQGIGYQWSLCYDRYGSCESRL